MRMLGALLGTPDDDGPRLVELGDALLGNTDPEFTEHVVDQVDTEQFRLMPFRSPAGIELFQYAKQQAALRRDNPTDDVISKLLAPTTDGEPLTELEFDNFFTLLVAAGNDTTRYTMAGSLKALMDRPELFEFLRNADDEQWRVATDELLRWTSVTTHFRRTATCDVELHGQHIRQGDKVVVYFISGNFDEQQFADPFMLDLTRQPNDHMAFGRGGPHLCLGAWLARMEIRVTFQELVKRISSIEQTAPEDYLRSNFISGIKHLPVRDHRTVVSDTCYARSHAQYGSTASDSTVRWIVRRESARACFWRSSRALETAVSWALNSGNNERISGHPWRSPSPAPSAGRQDGFGEPRVRAPRAW